MSFVTTIKRRIPFRISLKNSVIALCMLYILGMLLFYSGIQTTPAKSHQAEYPRNLPNVPSHRDGEMPNDSLQQRQKTEVEKLPLHIRRKYDQLTPKYPAMRENNPQLPQPVRHEEIDHAHGRCVGPMQGSEFDFVEVVTKKAFVYSAYWDTRPNDFDNKHNGSFIRMMAVVKTAGKHPAIRCTFHGGNVDVDHTMVDYYEMCENHGKPFGGFILSCPVPPEIPGQPCVVILSQENSNEEYTLKVQTLHPGEEMNKYSVCTPPLHGEVKASKLIEFIEMSRILGAEHLTFYDYQITEDTARVLEHYQEKDIVDVVPWLYPERLEKGSWYHGQSIAIQDCLYRNMAKSRFTTFNDIDEYIVPRKHETWDEMITDTFKVGQCAFQFNSAFFAPPNDDSPEVVLSAMTRSKLFTKVRTKCMVKPSLVFEAGIHHISKPIWASLAVEKMPEDIAFLHHYRECLGDFGMNCKEKVTDDFMRKFSSKLRQNVKEVYSNMNS